MRVALATVLAVSATVPPAYAQSAPQGTTVDASRGGVTVASGVNSLTINARAQVRWTLDTREDGDADTTGTGAGRVDGPVSAFDVPRLRLTLSGGAWRPWLRYSFQVDFSRTGGEGASKVKDAVLEIRPEGRSFRVQAGQFKAPFGLQQLTSSGRLQFVDRAITDAKFNPGRDMGAMFSGTLARRRVGYEAAVFNGSGESLRQTTDTHLLVGRLYVQPLGPYALAEGAVDAAPKPVVHIGAGVRSGKQIRGRTAAGIVEQPDNQTAANLEFAFKGGRLFSTAEYFWMRDEQLNPAAGRDIHSRGFHAQGGYVLVPRVVDVGLLYARITPDTEVEDAATTELRGVVGYYWQAHNLKLQADIGALGYDSRFATLSPRARQGLTALGARTSAGSFRDTQLRVQLQVAF